MTEACEKLKSQLDSANARSSDLQKKTTKLEQENTALHQKVAQAKGSIMIDANMSADSHPDLVPRPDSSKLRMRLDDSSQISQTKSVLSQEINQRRPGFSPDVQQNKLMTPDVDFDDMESINENIPKARQMELLRLREENFELKSQLK